MEPYLKWPGGKRWLVDRLRPSIDAAERYIEPFLGSASIFLMTAPKKAILSDVNPKLIEVHEVVRDRPRDLSTILKSYQDRHSKQAYYEARSVIPVDKVERAARFLYLNRTCFNGMYRENRFGAFNVPLGDKTKVFVSTFEFDQASKRLHEADINCCDFEIAIDQAVAGDFIYVDPPYTTAHNLNGFVKYNASLFTWDDQIRLRNSLEDAMLRGAHFMMSNADHESIHELYNGLPRASLTRKSVISGLPKGRSATTEAIISSIDA